MDLKADDQVRCPTCGAHQAWSDSCRRCRCDLRLLRAAYSARRHHRLSCILHLEAGQPAIALGHALRCHDLQPDAESRRLLALCAIAREEWETATDLIQTADQ